MQNTTTLTCYVKQNEAISRGFNSPSVVKIEVDVSELSQERRDIIAAYFNPSNGSFAIVIPQPDIDGLIEAIDGHLEALKSGQYQPSKVSLYEAKYAQKLAN